LVKANFCPIGDFFKPFLFLTIFFINMSSKLHQAALDYHQGKRPGKLIVSSHKPLETREDLSLATFSASQKKPKGVQPSDKTRRQSSLVTGKLIISNEVFA
jgi:hypothetical protein